ncbi:cysteine hydrolase family protein [Cohnella silvisoli]|uniref:Isochorismatase family cysteine hydrolase n=1 Tax=Cohnella silvisoli TaxID=2873699 RepID=A0ABV1L0S0_9BACL|nr:isochorismatase family cysteine hydrolase [Cohnella silvisoli]MCD9024689.1 cysteine hydrolase [Cohnella silvisoli]
MVDIPNAGMALLLVDVQRDFCAKDGKMSEWDADLSAVDPAVDRIEELIAAARATHVPIIYIALVTSPETDSPAMLEWYARQGQDLSGVAVCRTSTAGADFYRIAPLPGDMVVHKQRYSGFVGTNLELMLKSNGIRKLLVTGFTTECCVESTVRDGFMRDYECFVVSDACAAYSPDIHEASMRAMELNFATSVTTEQVVRSWGTVIGG